MKQIHIWCSCCKAQVTINGADDQAPLASFLEKLQHKMKCYRKSIKMEEVNDNQGPYD